MRMRTVVAMVVAVIVCVWAVEGWGWGWPKSQSITPQTQEVDTVAGTVERYFSRGMSCSGKIGDLSWFVVGDRISLCQDLLLAQLFIAEVQLIIAKEAEPAIHPKGGPRHQVFGISFVKGSETGIAPMYEFRDIERAP